MKQTLKKNLSKSNKELRQEEVKPVDMAPPLIRCFYEEEPLLEFCDGREHIDPKLGIAMFGPYSKNSSRHPKEIKLGMIGTAGTISDAQIWLEQASKRVRGDESDLGFPGFKSDRGFHSDIVFANDWAMTLSSNEVASILSIRNTRQRFESLLNSLEEKFQILTRKDRRPDIAVIALPDEIFRDCRVIEYSSKELGFIHRDLRRAIKSVAMKYQLSTQIIRQQTFEDKTGDKPAKIAWNLFTGLYFKAGGMPWGPTGLSAGSCFLGVSFYRPLGTIRSSIRSSIIQAFDEHGNGLVLRGPEFEWNVDTYGAVSPHLSSEQAYSLASIALTRYRQEMGQVPKRVVVHKTSRFWPDEREGFLAAINTIGASHDLLSLSNQQDIRLIPVSKYPALRGTRFAIGDTDYLYTTGYVAELDKYYGLHLPLPIQISDHVGLDTSRNSLLREVLILTKMNWNSARLGGLFPITIRFSRLVGDILREIPDDRDPLASFKYYM